MTTQTKACLDPWSFLMIKADGNVSLCCWSAPIGNTNASDLDEIVTGLKAQHLRSSLLTGELMGCCLACPARGNTTTDALQKDVETYLKDSEKRYTISQGQLVATEANQPNTSATTPQGSTQPRGGSKTKRLVKAMRALLNTSASNP